MPMRSVPIIRTLASAGISVYLRSPVRRSHEGRRLDLPATPQPARATAGGPLNYPNQHCHGDEEEAEEGLADDYVLLAPFDEGLGAETIVGQNKGEHQRDDEHGVVEQEI